MGFFDQLSKKAAETVQGAKEKTSKISNEMKLKSQFSDKKDRIVVLYNEIGKEIYSNYTKGIENVTEEIKEKCKEISNINEELKAINTELLALKNIKICSSCGAQVPVNSEFCSKCGVKQVIVVESAPENATEVIKVEESTDIPEKTVENNENKTEENDG